jgi:hypothetical protein
MSKKEADAQEPGVEAPGAPGATSLEHGAKLVAYGAGQGPPEAGGEAAHP